MSRDLAGRTQCLREHRRRRPQYSGRDVVAVPRAELVYVAGAVRNSGGFVLNERDDMTACG